jgi:hypothetical protein
MTLADGKQSLRVEAKSTRSRRQKLNSVRTLKLKSYLVQTQRRDRHSVETSRQAPRTLDLPRFRGGSVQRVRERRPTHRSALARCLTGPRTLRFAETREHASWRYGIETLDFPGEI